jgi:hypothetical protein
MPTIKVTDRAQAAAPIATLTNLANAEIVRHFGPDFQFHSGPAATSEIRLHVYVAGNWLVLFPLGPALWCLDTVDMRRVASIEPVRFSGRAAALISALGWSPDAVTIAAREAIARADEDDHSVAFAVPIEHANFAVWRDGDGQAEIDLDDTALEVRS